MIDLIDYIHQSPSPAHAVQASCRMLQEAGFTPLEPNVRWELAAGGRYYVPIFGTSLVAFTIGSDWKPSDALHLAAAHTDYPCLRVKPAPEQVAGGCCKLNIEPYGGMIYSTWLDRPLSMAGRISIKTDDPLLPKTRLVRFDRPVLTIPNLAIHMNREINKSVELKPAVDLLPLCRTVGEKWEKDGYLLHKLAQTAGCGEDEILSYDLCVCNAEPATLVGLEQDMLSSPRLDNLTSCYACIRALLGAKHTRGVNAAVLFDNEEVGSKTKQGADSALLSHILEKIALTMGLDRLDFLNSLMGGLLLSCDVAHAAHPNHMELSDPSCQPVMNGGVVIKLNHNQAYPTDPTGTALVEGLCRAHGISHQWFMNKAGQRGGSTLGALASAQLAMPTVDIGVPILAMHSARELMGAKDEEALIELLSAFFART